MAWRKQQELGVHPVADLFPMLNDDDLAEMAADIKQRGLLQPIVLDGEGRILDGRNRHAACKIAGVDPVFVTYDGADPDGYALAVNAQRRNTTKGQRAVVGALLLNNNSEVTQTQAAAALSVSQPLIAQAVTVVKYGSPDLPDLVLSGTLMLFPDAYKEAQKRKAAKVETDAKMARLRKLADDLADLVAEGRMSVADAIGALDVRVTAEQRAADEAKRKADEEAKYRRVAIEQENEWLGFAVERLGAFHTHPAIAKDRYEQFLHTDTNWRRPITRDDINQAISGLTNLSENWETPR